MIVRFCLYSVFKNLRFADPFFVLYLLALGGSGRALAVCYVLATAVGLLLIVSLLFWHGWLLAAAASFVTLTLLQNVRRPTFVSALNGEMEKSMRATILSVESAVRSVCLAVTLPVVGLVADRFGLQYALLLPSLVLIAGLPLVLVRPTKAGVPSDFVSAEEMASSKSSE